MSRQPSGAVMEADRQTYCCGARDMCLTTVRRRMGWESHAALKRLTRNQQQNDRPATGGKPRQSKQEEEGRRGDVKRRQERREKEVEGEERGTGGEKR